MNKPQNLFLGKACLDASMVFRLITSLVEWSLRLDPISMSGLVVFLLKKLVSGKSLSRCIDGVPPKYFSCRMVFETRPYSKQFTCENEARANLSRVVGNES
ncbi:hypothetical protein JTE90_010457 [Oedothorax gibbosus]|uniref:Uncharacterized protein n=1 Tax=Oedothorax gibbosus TaxID=931172 RepID=A0AAV6VZR3_9ARAC|nr:hypothetical protein JTE90_010457 [Oedothorax gibbosus]